MATHATLRTDVISPDALVTRTAKVLVPGPTWPDNPRDVTLEEISFLDPESVREFADNVAELQKASTLGVAKSASDVIYQDVFRRSVTGNDILYAANPDDPANPTVITVGAGAATVIWEDEGVAVLTSGTFNAVGAGVTLTDVGGVATLTVTGGGTTYTNGDGLSLTVTTFAVIGYEGIKVDGNGVSVDLEANKGLEFDTSGAAAKLRAKIGTGIQFASGAIAANISAGTGITVTSGYIVAVNLTEGLYIDISGATIGVDLTEIPNHKTDGTHQVIHNQTGTHTWNDATQKTIWGLDPDGGHTITSSGTTLTLTLKVTKYSFDLIDLTSETDANLIIEYVGTACP